MADADLYVFRMGRRWHVKAGRYCSRAYGSREAAFGAALGRATDAEADAMARPRILVQDAMTDRFALRWQAGDDVPSREQMRRLLAQPATGTPDSQPRWPRTRVTDLARAG